MRRPALLSLAILSAAPVACSSYSSYVETENAALGRVVVYRNGIAFYERRAKVEDGKVTLTVPHDKVDDFLKSLTISDAATGKPLPVNYPTAGASNDGKVDMTIQVQVAGVSEVVLTYITEAPAWKPSYRVVVKADGKLGLQGWAVVDNTSGETWNKVKVGVGSSSALSFRFDLRSVRNVFREELKSRESFAVAPPVGGSTYSDRETQAAVLDTFADDEIAGDLANDARGAFNRSGRDVDGAPRPASVEAARAPAAPPASRAKVKQLAAKLNQTEGDVTLQAWGGAGAGPAKDGFTPEDRAQWLRNELIREGVAPARIKVEAKSDANKRGLEIVNAPSAPGREQRPGIPDDGKPVGESHFQAPVPVTVARGTSALIAVVDQEAEGDVVYLYDPDSERGNKRFAFKSVRIKNPTDYTLETGPMTVYGAERFIGEGLTEPVPPRATAVIPFALDREVIVERDDSEADKITRLVALQRGILRTEVQHERVTKLKLTSLLHMPTRVFLKHTVRKGWDLVASDKSPKLYERMGEAHLFEVKLAAGETKSIEIREATPIVRALDLRGPDSMGLVELYLQGKDIDQRFAEPLKKLLEIHQQMGNIAQKIELVRSRMEEYRTRTQELTDQILTLKGVPGGGALMAHLQAKLREMSQGVQNGTIEVVNLEQQMMVSRIQFQDGVSELRLEREAAKPTEAPKPNGG